jgi:hypothetical protein
MTISQSAGLTTRFETASDLSAGPGFEPGYAYADGFTVHPSRLRLITANPGSRWSRPWVSLGKHCAATSLGLNLVSSADYCLTCEGLQETSVRPWLLGRCWMGFAYTANFDAQRGVDRSPAKAAGTNRRDRIAGFVPAPIFMRCTLNIDRFVLAVIASRKSITQTISVRFARRPFRNNYVGGDPVIRKDILHGLFQLVFSPPGA